MDVKEAGLLDHVAFAAVLQLTFEDYAFETRVEDTIENRIAYVYYSCYQAAQEKFCCIFHFLVHLVAQIEESRRIDRAEGLPN